MIVWTEFDRETSGEYLLAKDWIWKWSKVYHCSFVCITKIDVIKSLIVRVLTPKDTGTRTGCMVGQKS